MSVYSTTLFIDDCIVINEYDEYVQLEEPMELDKRKLFLS